MTKVRSGQRELQKLPSISDHRGHLQAVLRLRHPRVAAELADLCTLLDGRIAPVEAVRRTLLEAQDDGCDDGLDPVESEQLEGRLAAAAQDYAALRNRHLFELRDELMEYSLPSAKPDWGHWQGLPYWTGAEAAALSLNKDPRSLREADLDGDERLPTIQAFQKQHERIRRALDLKLVGDGDAVIPKRLAIWLNDAALTKALGITQKPMKGSRADSVRDANPHEEAEIAAPSPPQPVSSSKEPVPSAPMPRTGLVRLSQILAPVGPLPVSRSTFWAKVKSGEFPQPVRLGSRTTAWRAEEIWALVDARDAKVAKKR